MENDELSSTEKFESYLEESEYQEYVLKLYVAGMTDKSRQAVERVREICEEHLENRYQLEVVDIYQKASLAKGDQIVAAPTLVKKLPPPLQKIIGDMSDKDKLLVGLDLKEADPE